MPAVRGERMNPVWGTGTNKPANKRKNLAKAAPAQLLCLSSTALASQSSAVGNFCQRKRWGREEAGTGVGERASSFRASWCPDRDCPTAAGRVFQPFSSGREGPLRFVGIGKNGRISLDRRGLTVLSARGKVRVERVLGHTPGRTRTYGSLLRRQML